MLDHRLTRKKLVLLAVCALTTLAVAVIWSNESQLTEQHHGEQSHLNATSYNNTERTTQATKNASQNIQSSQLLPTDRASKSITIDKKIASESTITVRALAHNSEAKHIDAKHLPYANPDAPKGGILSLSAIGSFNSANPWQTSGVAMQGTNYLYDTLMTGSLDEAFVMYPLLAEKVTYDPNDASWVVYHLNQNAKFWDGTSVTSADVQATFDALLNKGAMQVRSYLAEVDRVEVLDAHRVMFHFKTAENHEAKLLVGQFPIFKKASIENDFETLSLEPLMGSGAYQLESVDEGRSVTYRRDPNYWGKDLMVNRGHFNFDRIKYVYYGSDEVALEGFKVGQYQFRQENTARKWATAYNFRAVKAGLIDKEAITLDNPVPMQALVMNNRRQLFDDIRVRQALTNAFDFEVMNSTLFYGQYERLQSFFQGSELAGVGEPSQAERDVITPLLDKLDPVARQYVLKDWQYATTKGDGINREGLLQARALLLDAGFYYKDMMLYQPDGTPAQFELLIVNDGIARVVLPYARNLERLGFTVSIRLVDTAQYIERLRNYDFDMIMAVFAQSSSPGAEQLYFWGSASADEMGNRNYAGIKNDAIDEVIGKLTQAKSRDEIVLYSQVLDRLLRSGFYMVPMHGSGKARVVYWNKYRHTKPLPSSAIGIDYWWVDGKAEDKIEHYLKK